MHPKTRSAYLRAMGIQLWISKDSPVAIEGCCSFQSRWQLPVTNRILNVSQPLPTHHNRSNFQADSNSAVNLEATAHINRKSTAVSSPYKQRINEQLAATHQKTTVQKEAVPIVKSNHAIPEEQPIKQAAISPFRLACISHNENLLFVTDMPIQGENKLSDAHLKLSYNMTKALGFSASDTAKWLYFSWPLSRNKFFASLNYFASAKAAFTGFLDNQCGFNRRSHCILMGPLCSQLIGDALKFADRRGIKKLGNTHLVVTQPLDMIVQCPKIKSEVWKDISALKLCTTPQQKN